VTGLGAGDFQVREDGRPQTIATFAAGAFPLALAVGLDRSFSMTPERLAMAKSAARAFIRALRPADQVMVVAIGSETETVAPLSIDHVRAVAALDRLDRWGTTPLYDATLAAMDEIQPARGRRALILLSDGVDRFSRTSVSDLINRARRKDVLVYPIAIGQTKAPVLAELAAVTGGHAFVVRDARDVDATLAAIARELRSQYLLGYSPDAHEDGPRWHSIQVSVRRPGLHVRARDGYEAPER
jgi:Ca-activated chloride channel family protein